RGSGARGRRRAVLSALGGQPGVGERRVVGRGEVHRDVLVGAGVTGAHEVLLSCPLARDPLLPAPTSSRPRLSAPSGRRVCSTWPRADMRLLPKDLYCDRTTMGGWVKRKRTTRSRTVAIPRVQAKSLQAPIVSTKMI